MSQLADLLEEHTELGEGAVAHLSALLRDWQILSDLSFADLLLFVPSKRAEGRPAYLCAGQIRPYTAQTVYQEDLVAQLFPQSNRPLVGRAFSEERVIRDADPDWSTGVPVREEAVPVRFKGEVIAVVTRESNVSTARSPSQLELTYLQTAGELAVMLADGTFPYPQTDELEEDVALGTANRVGDGIVRMDATGFCVYVSPNAISSYRRLGSLDNVGGQHLQDFDPQCEGLLEGLTEREPVEQEVERQGTVVQRRMLPLIQNGVVVAGLLIVREVTELRRHQRALKVKDATIREIHHRVKNNLQTVASLLRLQVRRTDNTEAKLALSESVRRISSIALVHEMLSEESQQRVDFDRVASRILKMLGDGLMSPDVPIELRVEGSAGELQAEVATPLALIVTELLQNSVEHAFPPAWAEHAPRGPDGKPTGHVEVHFERSPSTFQMLVTDDGIGLPPGQTLEGMSNLGLQIARTLAESELGGAFGILRPGSGNGVEPEPPLPGTTFRLVTQLT
jgi:two-component system, sensor histidine kinase PdtaS